MTSPAHLYAVWRYDVAEVVVVVAEELGKVVQQDEQHPQTAAVQDRDRLGQLGVTQEGGEEVEQVDQQLGVRTPALRTNTTSETRPGKTHKLKHTSPVKTS